MSDLSTFQDTLAFVRNTKASFRVSLRSRKLRNTIKRRRIRAFAPKKPPKPLTTEEKLEMGKADYLKGICAGLFRAFQARDIAGISKAVRAIRRFFFGNYSKVSSFGAQIASYGVFKLLLQILSNSKELLGSEEKVTLVEETSWLVSNLIVDETLAKVFMASGGAKILLGIIFVHPTNLMVVCHAF